MSNPDPASRNSAGTRMYHFLGLFQGQAASAPIAKSAPTRAAGEVLSLFLNLFHNHCALAQTASSQSNPRNMERIQYQYILLAMIMHKLLLLSMMKNAPFTPFGRYTYLPL